MPTLQLTKIISKIACVFDDIPFLLKGLLTKSLDALGSYMLAGASGVMFPLNIYEGITGLRKALKLPKDNPKRKTMITANLTKICLATGGLGIATGLVVTTILSTAVAGPILSLLVPAVMAGITGTEFWQKLHRYKLTKKMSEGIEKEEKLIKTKRRIGFSSIYLFLIIGITAMAGLSTLTALGVASFGIVPSAVLVGLVCLAVGTKIFQLVDKHKNYKFTNSIKDFFANLFKHKKIDPDKTDALLNNPENKEIIKSTYELMAKQGLLSLSADKQITSSKATSEDDVNPAPTSPFLSSTHDEPDLQYKDRYVIGNR